ncbi:MAG: hypothetical protein ACRD0Y_04625 [Terriglobales bacterium]
MVRLCLAWLGLAMSSGCVLPEISRQPSVHNPFPQLQKVAIAPFFNLSTEPTVDGRHVALAYFSELQVIPGFEVIPIGVVEKTLEAHQMTLNGPADARKLAQLLDVDAVVVGAVTDFSPYYPPRLALQAEWYAANPCFHPIPAGYGLPWGTPAEDEIPGTLIFESEMALARAQMKTQTPRYVKPHYPMPPPPEPPPPGMQPDEEGADGLPPGEPNDSGSDGELMAYRQILPTPAETGGAVLLDAAGRPVAAGGGQVAAAGTTGPGLPFDWPDARGFQPAGPSPATPPCRPSDEPVLRHTKTYHGSDSDLTTALASYAYFRDDARYGGWQAYLQRSDDFIRFCCHMHITEMLTARGGAGQTRVVWRWPIRR